mgnify:CR=1 FL=1
MNLPTDDDDPILRRMMRWLARPAVKLRRVDTEVREDLWGARHALSYVRHLARGNRIKRKAFFDRIDDTHPPVT